MGNQDKAFMRNLIVVMGGLVALAVIVFVTAQQLAGPAKMDIKDTEMNIARAGTSVTANDKVRVAAKVVVAKKTAAQLGGTCMGCHATGVAGAPKVGDAAAWAPRAKLGVAALVKSVIKGKGAMPPKGATTLTEAEITIVVKDMLTRSAK
ncbi:Cytochrome c5 [hydrothermal vent metagenome]|uniref:Cytochrome c5 n=1 Tax=hydrothermal vent metagenome TaxID=652676 RepID=A0A3B0Z0S8_9ZZZZ